MAASAAERSAGAEQSHALMIKNLLEPLEPYPGGNQLRWKCRCLTCGAIVFPTRGNISRGQGGCVPCGTKRRALARLGDAGRAVADMLGALLEPLDDYPGTNAPWRCRCLRCDGEVRPRLSHIRAGRGGCLMCGFAATAAKQLGDPVRAEADMRAEGYAPLEPYPGAGKGWRCIHEPCGNEVRARLQKIRAGEGCCAHCASYGFNLTAPAVVYVLHHEELGAVKVGITAADSDRIDRFTRKGWSTVHVMPFATGRQARDVEQAVLRHLRTERRLMPYLTLLELAGLRGDLAPGHVQGALLGRTPVEDERGYGCGQGGGDRNESRGAEQGRPAVGADRTLRPVGIGPDLRDHRMQVRRG